MEFCVDDFGVEKETALVLLGEYSGDGVDPTRNDFPKI